MQNHLEHLQEFDEILADYEVNTDNPVLDRVELVLMIGPTAVGRDTTIELLTETGRYRHIVSSTTRHPRANKGKMEQHGVEYWFITEDEMLNNLRERRMLEAEVIHDQQVSGISLEELEKAAQEDKVAITNVELNIRSIVEAVPSTIPIMMLPPSFEEWLRRLHERGELSPDEIRRRLTTAVKIFRAGLEWSIFNFVVNDTLEHAVEQVEAIVENRESTDEQVEHRELAQKLLDETEAWLTS